MAPLLNMRCDQHPHADRNDATVLDTFNLYPTLNVLVSMHTTYESDEIQFLIVSL